MFKFRCDLFFPNILDNNTVNNLTCQKNKAVNLDRSSITSWFSSWPVKALFTRSVFQPVFVGGSFDLFDAMCKHLHWILLNPFFNGLKNGLKNATCKRTLNCKFPVLGRTIVRVFYNQVSIPVADPGFPRRGGANPRGGGRQHTILTNFSQKLHENEENLTQRGGRASLRPPLDPPMHSILTVL